MSDFLVPQRWGGGGEPPTLDPLLPSQPPEQGEQESVLQMAVGYLQLVRRHLLLVLLCTLGALAVAVFQMRRDQPLYRATAVVRLTDKSRELSGGLVSDPAARMVGSGADAVLTQIQVLQSRAVATEVAARTGLRLVADTRGIAAGWLDGVEVAPTAPNGTLQLTFSDRDVTVRAGSATATAAYGTPVELNGVRFTVLRRPAPEAVTLRVIPLEDAAETVMASLHGRPREHTDIVDIFYTAPDPRLAQRVVNTAALVFQDLSARTDKQTSVRRREFIEKQLEKADMKFAEAQLAHNEFRRRAQVYSSQDKFKAQQSDLFDLDLRRQELAANRKSLQSVLEELERARARTGGATSGERLSALMAAPEVSGNPVIAQLYAKLVEYQTTREGMTTGGWGSAAGNPDVVRLDTLVASTQTRLVAAVRGQISALDARLAAVDDLRGHAATQMAALPNMEAEEARLLMQVDTYRREADMLREELQRAQIEEAAETGQVDIVDPATLPTVPIGSGRGSRAVLALLLGLAFGSVAAYVLENYRAVIRRREDLRQFVPVPNLAVVPPIHLAATASSPLARWVRRSLPTPAASNGAHGTNGDGLISARERSLVTIVDGRSMGAEAFRTLRTGLLFSSVVQRQRQIVVTSAGPSEGKSTVAANLAVAFAHQGHGTVLVDCDLRRPRIHEVFGAPQMPGLTNALLGGLAASDVVRPTAIEGLSVITAGLTPPNPAELLGSQRMQQLLDQLAQQYDVVIVDTPPVLVASDAAILGRRADGTLLVVRAGQTHAAALRDAVQHLTQVGVRVTGTVLNDPDGELAKFASYYGYFYKDYYGSSPTTVAAP